MDAPNPHPYPHPPPQAPVPEGPPSHPFPHPHHVHPEYDHDVTSHERNLFWVVCAISNPIRFKTRYALYRRFRHHILHELGANLVTVECAEGQRAFQVTGDRQMDRGAPPPGHVRHIEVQVRRETRMWDKEVLQNIGVGRLPLDAKYVMFCDADVTFVDLDIVTETIHALQLHRVVQPFETCADMGPNGQIMQVHRSFGYCHARGWDWQPLPVARSASTSAEPAEPDESRGAVYNYAYDDSGPPSRPKAKGGGGGGGGGGCWGAGMSDFGVKWHPGFCMAFRKDVLDRLGGLIDVGVLGAGDHHMCAAMIGKARMTYPAKINKNYKKKVAAWEALAELAVKRDFGYVRGSILHAFHGAKKSRAYISRWDVLLSNDFDPDLDVQIMRNGVHELISEKPLLHAEILRYFASRNEDDLNMD